MRGLLVALCLLTVSPLLRGQDQHPFGLGVRETPPLSPQEEEQSFHVPPGFRVTLVAAEPKIQKPMNLAFDSRGRLWMTGSVEYPFPAAAGQGRDAVKILEDIDGDGQADRITTFVDNLNIPIGLYPYKNGVIVFTIPDILFCEDTDGDGKADRRTKVLGPFDTTRDTHGMANAFRRGFDGWLYSCHGFNNRSEVAGTDGHRVTMHSGNTFRFRLDGSRIEHYTHGQVNPFGMVQDLFGDFYTSDCHTKPITLLLGGGHYQSFGRPHDGLGYVPDVMNHLHGSTAIAGLKQYTGSRFPEEYQHSLFVGNVMTSRVHRDVLQYTGSSVKAVEQEDFMSSDDPWFRPVDIEVGPDGALYIADFYNRIIGHYEVPLTHPGRDRERGRIWRVEYVGTPEQPARLQTVPNLAAADTSQLIAAFDHPHLGHRLRAMEEFTDRIGLSAVPALRSALNDNPSVTARIHLLWTLQRLGGLGDAELRAAGEAAEELVRVHAMRILESRREWPAALLQANIRGLQDSSAMVRRAAAQALAAHPETRQQVVLLKQLQQAAPEDVHLRHCLKMAARNHLREPGVLKDLPLDTLSPETRGLLSELALAIPTPEAGGLLVRLLAGNHIPENQLVPVLKHIAAHLQQSDVRTVVSLIQQRLRDQPDEQVELLESIRQGLQQQGIDAQAELNDWAETLCAELLATLSRSEPAWLPGSPAENFWGLEKRHCEDGLQNVDFLSSLPGGEGAMGILRSPEFVLPDRLTFFLCGHRGLPGKPALDANFVQLRLKDGRVIQKVYPPRHDTARRIEWNLTEYAGQTAVLELVDGINQPGYAWLAVSRFQPPVIRIPTNTAQQATRRLLAVARLADQFRVSAVRDRLATLLTDINRSPGLQAEIARTLATLDQNGPALALVSLLEDATLAEPLRQQIVAQLARDEPVNAEVLQQIARALPGAQQSRLAEALAGNREQIPLLLQLIEAGHVSARVLQQPKVREQLLVARIDGLEPRLEQLTASLPKVEDQILQTIARRREGYRAHTGSSENGAKVFEKTCMACHTLAGKGAKIGPQLEGIGNRGLDRLLEDILDPNRNVDVAFRARVFVLGSGQVQTGLFRREEGETIVIADEKGKEVIIPKAEIEEQNASTLSIMPANWHTAIPERDFYDLLRWLLEQRQELPKPSE